MLSFCNKLMKILPSRSSREQLCSDSSTKMPPAAVSSSAELLTSPIRLRKIDQLRDKNIGTYLPLPQLVAVGDQSSGKSSLLESITGIPFPRGQELCTRYATQITHRRESSQFINVSIIPAPNSSAKDKSRLEAYQKSVSTTAELQEQLPGILEEVNVRMGIRTAQNPGGTKTFTEDVLKIEKCGPGEDYLTVIDVPGIFRITTDNVTTEADKIMVSSMVQNYIRNNQTIILAVIPCNVDIATQEILALAEKYDPDGLRTLGILTKPDLLRERSTKSVVCDLVKGEKRCLKLGYHLVRSRGGDDDNSTSFGDAERDMLFKEEPWCNLPADRVGVVALRYRLQHLLGDITDKAFPKLRSEVRQLLSQARKDLFQLGQSRQTEKEQQQYLAAVTGEFQELVRAALNADYSFSSIFDDHRFRLITGVLNAADDFSHKFRSKAHTYEFFNEDAPENEEEDDPAESDTDMDQFPDLDDIISRNCDIEDPKSGIIQWLKGTHRRSRGSELTFNSTLFSGIVRQQTSKWKDMAEYFVSQIIYMIHQFITDVLEVVCSDTSVTNRLLSQTQDAIIERYGEAMKQTRALVEVERMGHPYTLNKAFWKNLAERIARRKREELSDKVETVRDKFNNTNRQMIDWESIKTTFDNRNSGEEITQDLHNLAKSYYDVARERFIDTLYLQVIAQQLIYGPNSPLRLFTERWVLELDAEKLEAIASESSQTSEQRRRLNKRIKDLVEASAILR